MTQVFLRGGGWQLRLPPPGARLSHNLIHDAAGQIIMPGGPLAMLDHNEVFNTGANAICIVPLERGFSAAQQSDTAAPGYVEGDGGVMYTGASLTSGYGMHYRENFIHHSLEVPGLHGRGGIYFVRLCFVEISMTYSRSLSRTRALCLSVLCCRMTTRTASQMFRATSCIRLRAEHFW